VKRLSDALVKELDFTTANAWAYAKTVLKRHSTDSPVCVAANAAKLTGDWPTGHYVPISLAWSRVPPLSQRQSEPASHVICCGRRHLTLVTGPKCALHSGREVLVHLFELLGRVCADMVSGLHDFAPKP
jgi:hypothetical protein